MENDFASVKNNLLNTKRYWDYAESLALHALRNFGKAEGKAFLAVLAEQYTTQSSVYKAFLQGPFKNFTAQDKIGLVRCILSVLSPQKRVEMMQYEFLDLLQKKRRKFLVDKLVSEGTVWYAFEQYIKFIETLPEIASQWFIAETINTEERQDVAHTVQYLALTEVLKEMQGFKQDVEAIRTHAKHKLDKLVYQARFFALEVRIDSQVYGLSANQERLFPTPTLPALHTDLQEILLDMISTQGRQGAEIVPTLAYDLATSLQHYRESQSLLGTVSVALHLQGSAGFIRFEAKSLPIVGEISKDVVDFTNGFLFFVGLIVGVPILGIFALFVLFFLGLAIGSVFMNPSIGLLFLLLAGMVGYPIWQISVEAIDYPQKKYAGISKEFHELYDAMFARPRLQDAEAGKAEGLEMILERLRMEVFELVYEMRAHDQYNIRHPDEFLKLYRKSLNRLKHLPKIAKRSPHILKILPAHIQPAVIWQLMYHVLLAELQNSHLQFTSLVDMALEYQLDAELYVKTLFRKVTLHKFRGRKARWLGVFLYRSRKLSTSDFYRVARKVYLEKELLDSTCQAWFVDKLEQFSEKNFERECMHLEKQIKTMAKIKDRSPDLATPILYENDMLLVHIW